MTSRIETIRETTGFPIGPAPDPLDEAREAALDAADDGDWTTADRVESLRVAALIARLAANFAEIVAPVYTDQAIRVVTRPGLWETGVAGLSAWDPACQGYVIVAGETPDRRAFLETLFHELGHIALGHVAKTDRLPAAIGYAVTEPSKTGSLIYADRRARLTDPDPEQRAFSQTRELQADHFTRRELAMWLSGGRP